MKSRVALFTALGIVAILASALALQGTIGWGASGQEIEQRPDKQGRKARAARQADQPPGPGRHLAFDVRPQDHRTTTRYALEITHPSGEMTTHDLKKPNLRRRTLMVPVPDLGPGKYQLVVIAEGPSGAQRSKPLPLEIPAK